MKTGEAPNSIYEIILCKANNSGKEIILLGISDHSYKLWRSYLAIIVK